MARIIGKFIKGVIGDAVFKTFGDVQIIQAKPKKNKSRRTEGTKKAASMFGVASNLAREFRMNLSALVTTFYDGTMIFRLNTEVLHSLRYAHNPETATFSFVEDSFCRLDGFDFNAKSPLENSLLAMPQVEFSENTLTVMLPALNIPKDLKFPKGATSCKILVGYTLYDLANCRRKIEFVSFDVLNKKGTTLPQSWEFEIQPGCVCITALSLQFAKSALAGETILNSKTFNPAAILKAVVIDGEVDKAVTKSWSRTNTEKIAVG